MISRWFEPPLCRAFPIASLLREAFPEHWLRIHGLPGSKRYPETRAERRIVLDRYASFGTALLGRAAPCLAVQSRLNGCAFDPGLVPRATDWRPIHRLVKCEEAEDEDERGVWDSWVAPVGWAPATLKTLLLAIADDQEGDVAFLSEVTGAVFIPYDGGADGFSPDIPTIRRLRREFAPWRSKLTSGL